jgi:hypothetical protein
MFQMPCFITLRSGHNTVDLSVAERPDPPARSVQDGTVPPRHWDRSCRANDPEVRQNPDQPSSASYYEPLWDVGAFVVRPNRQYVAATATRTGLESGSASHESAQAKHPSVSLAATPGGEPPISRQGEAYAS